MTSPWVFFTKIETLHTPACHFLFRVFVLMKRRERPRGGTPAGRKSAKVDLEDAYFEPHLIAEATADLGYILPEED